MNKIYIISLQLASPISMVFHYNYFKTNGIRGYGNNICNQEQFISYKSLKSVGGSLISEVSVLNPSVKSNQSDKPSE